MKTGPDKQPGRKSFAAPARGRSRLARVPDHELIQRIGAGSYGDVWLARNVMGSFRAAKIVFRDKFSDPRPFDREFAGLKRFEPISRTHPGFVAILHVGRNESAGYFYCIMELADDAAAGAPGQSGHYTPRTLSQELAIRGRLPPEECVQIGVDLAAALDHLHEKGLVHRDLKPSNVIFVNGAPKLADIGLVTAIGEPATAVGTEGYMPPEGPGTPTADLYSLGMVLYQIATGKSLQQFPDLPTGLRELGNAPQLMRLNEVILRATERDPRRRYQSAAEMRDDLSRQGRSGLRRDAAQNEATVRSLKRPVAQAAFEGERKQVTALAFDVCWRQKVDPEDAHILLQQICEMLEGELARYGGAVNQPLSTGLLAVFGAPMGYEDHARRAVLAAAAIQKTLAQRDEIRREKGISFEIRCGVDTALAVVTETASSPGPITGDPFQMAVRLCHHAKPGQILISEETWKAVRDEFLTQSMGGPGIPGSRGPLAVYEVSGVVERSSLEGAAGKRLSPFVGRSKELSMLHERFAESANGRGQVVLLAGEPGMGKSRLLLEFRRSLDNAASWLIGRSLSFGREMALLPVIEMVKQFLGIEPGEGPSANAQKCGILDRQITTGVEWTRPYLKFLLGASTEDDGISQMDARQRKTKTFEALRAVLWQKAQGQPLVIALEDLHWIDRASEEFITYLADSIAMAPLLLVATYRPDYQNPFPERTYITRTTLTRLSEVDSVQIAQSVLGSNLCPANLQELIQVKAEGNPFFVEELVKSLIETGALSVQDGGYSLVPGLSDIEVPDTVQNVLMSRVDRLPGPAKKTLQLASVIGREFHLALLETISDVHDPLPESLQHLKNAELIYERTLLPDATWVFKHALTQEVAYSSLLIQRRKKLHRLVAASIEELYAGRLSDFYGTLAYHYQLGEEWERALDYLLRAAESAQRIGGYREQAGLLTQAIAIAERLGHHQRIPELRGRRGTAYTRSGLWAEARPELERALADLPPDQVEYRAELLLELAGVCFWALDIPAMTHYALQGHVLAGQLGRDDLLAGMMGWLAAADQAAGNLDSATERYEQAWRRGGGFRSPSLAQYALVLYWSGRIDEAIDRGRQCAEMCSSLADNLTAIFGNPHLGLALAAAGRYDEAMRLFDKILELGSKHEVWPFHARAMAISAGLHLDVFDYAGHEAIAEEARERARTVGWQPPVVSAGLDLVFNYARRGEVSRAEKLLTESAEAAQLTGGWHRWLWELRLAQARAEVALAREDWPAAWQWAAESIAKSSARGRIKYHVAGLTTRARALAACGRKEEAITDLRYALKLARPVGDPAMFLRVCHPLLQVEGDDDLAKEAQAAAQRIFAALPTEPMRQRFLARAEG